MSGNTGRRALLPVTAGDGQQWPSCGQDAASWPLAGFGPGEYWFRLQAGGIDLLRKVALTA